MFSIVYLYVGFLPSIAEGANHWIDLACCGGLVDFLFLLLSCQAKPFFANRIIKPFNSVINIGSGLLCARKHKCLDTRQARVKSRGYHRHIKSKMSQKS